MPDTCRGHCDILQRELERLGVGKHVGVVKAFAVRSGMPTFFNLYPSETGRDLRSYEAILEDTTTVSTSFERALRALRTLHAPSDPQTVLMAIRSVARKVYGGMLDDA